jgi:hypothetical protein
VSRLTPGQAELLVEVYRHPERGPAEHSRAMGKDVGWIGKLTNRLEQLGLVKRERLKRRAPGSRTLRPIRPLHKALMVRHGRVVAFGDDGRGRRLPVAPRWTEALLLTAPLLLGQLALVFYRDPPP